MLRVYRNKTLRWEQANFIEDTQFDLCLGEQHVLSYRTIKPLRAVIQSATENLELRLKGGEWHISSDGRGPITRVKGLLKPSGGVSIGDVRYTWQSYNPLGNERVFRDANGDEVLRVKAATWSLKAHAEVKIGAANTPARDLVVLCGLGLHMMVLERMVASIVLIAAALLVMLL